MSFADYCIRICAFILLLTSFSAAFRDPIDDSDQTHKVVARSTRHYCGQNLVRTLRFLCESYNKRSSVGPYFRHPNVLSRDVWNDNQMLSTDETDESSRLAILSLLHNRNDMSHFHRTVRGVVDECCRQSCTTSQLSQYCDRIRTTTTTVAPPLIE